MVKEDRKEHWDAIYSTKTPEEVSWTEAAPQTSLAAIRALNLPKTAAIIDIGGGDSRLVDCLLDEGYTSITVLDISGKAHERAKARLGDRAAKVTWIVADVREFNPTDSYDLWHDRAAFHFLTEDPDVAAYAKMASRSLNPGGALIIGTFSIKGPKKCSGLDIKQYSEALMSSVFSPYFKRIECKAHEHHTPFGTLQHFIFCTFRKLS